MAERISIPGFVRGVELLAELHPYVRHCGDARRGPWRIRERSLLDYLLVYITEGRGRFIIAGVEYDAEPNDLFWIPPQTLHDMEGFAPSMVCPYIHFDLAYNRTNSHWDFSIPGGMRDLSELNPLLTQKVSHPVLEQLCGRLRLHTNRRVGNLICEICAEAARAQPYAPLRMSGLLVEVVAEILRGQSGANAGGNAHVPLLEDAADYLRQHCTERVRLEEVAEICGLSGSHFRSLFARYFGCPPREYLRQARIQKAKLMMVGASLNLSQIAYRSGFATVHSFSRAFRELEGLSPSQYRRCGPSVGTRVEGRHTPYTR